MAKRKEIKICDSLSHEWYEIGKCKDVIIGHPCKYHPEGCDNCLTRFECYTKDNTTYSTRMSGIFYACKKCPTIKLDGTESAWQTTPITSRDGIPYTTTDIRRSSFKGMEVNIITKQRERWNLN